MTSRRDGPFQFGLECFLESIGDIARRCGPELGEEPVDDQSTGFAFGDATRHQVEQLVIVESARDARVARTNHFAGLDLEVGHRVGPRAALSNRLRLIS